MSLLLTTFIVSICLNLGLFLIAFRYKSDRLTDASYALSFIALAILSLVIGTNTEWFGRIVAGMVILWALRIGIFLLMRIVKKGTDSRFDGIRGNFWAFGRFWLSQGISVWILMLPTILLFGHKTPRVSLIGTLIGGAIWVIGLTLETIADYQKRRFAAQASNANRWIDIGLWHYSRHPNYFGEMLIWIGIYCYAFGSLTGIERLIGLVSPLLICILLRFISGVPLLEKSADKRWGTQPSYRAYKAHTSLLVPLPRR